MASADGTEHDVQTQFSALLEGLRTTLPGVQLITAFLLTLPLYPNFDRLSQVDRAAYYLAFGAALASSVLLMAPSAHQRLRAGRTVVRRSPRHLSVAVRLTIAGTICFAVALTAVAYLVSSIVLGSGTAAAVAVAVAAFGGWSWFWLPLVTFRDD